MRIIVRMNRPEYFNDVAEEIRLFLGLSDVEFAEEGAAPDPSAQIQIDAYLRKSGYAYICSVSCGATSLKSSFLLKAQDSLTIKKVEKRQIKLLTYSVLKSVFPEVQTPWGALTGIRPTKLFREIKDASDEETAVREFLDLYNVSIEKTALAAEITERQAPIIASVQPEDLDVYIGIPFCTSRCLYCSFPAQVLPSSNTLETYLEALKEDIRLGAQTARESGRRIRAVYVGGGTPTILSAKQMEDLFSFAMKEYGGFGQELTVEAGRPDTINPEKLRVIADAGANRICINPQTMSDETLSRIGRSHTVEQIIDSFVLARKTGFSCINMDVIAGLPGETVEIFEHSIGKVLALRPDNLTVHSLSIKRAAELKMQLDKYPLPKPEEVSEMIDFARDSAQKVGLGPYYMYRQKYMSGNLENVGYAKYKKESIYNIDMMEETVPIMAHGAGAISKWISKDGSRIERVANGKDYHTYLGKLGQIDQRRRELFLSER